MLHALAEHWPEYLMEAALLGLFMVSAALFTALIEHPASPVRMHLDRLVRVGKSSALTRRALIGLAMGLTAVALIYSPWGARSGAHMNPAFTLAMLSLGKVAPADAAWYCLFQVIGGALGVLACAIALPGVMRHESVGYVVTVPRSEPRRGRRRAAFIAEVVISAILMGVALAMSNEVSLAPYTGLAAGALLVAFIAFEAPLSGMSINPARTIASAIVARRWDSIWIYLVAPTLAMQAAAFAYAGIAGSDHVLCAKVNHTTSDRCIFHCRYGSARSK